MKGLIDIILLGPLNVLQARVGHRALHLTWDD